MSGLRLGVVGVPGKWSTEALAEAVERRTSFRRVIDMAHVTADLGGRSLLANGFDLCSLDGLIVKKISERYSPASLDRIELLRVAEQAGVRVFSKCETIIRMMDRLSCTMTLSGAGIPMPRTVVTEDPEETFRVVREYGEAIMKPLFSTKARGMCVLGPSLTDQELRQAIDAFRVQNPMMYIQQKVPLPGQDLGIVFLGGRYLGAYARVARNNAWNTTIQDGGKYEPSQPPPDVIDLARRAQDLFAMDFTTVDVAETPDGPVVFEVSAFGGFRGAKEGIGIDAAELLVEHVVGELA